MVKEPEIISKILKNGLVINHIKSNCPDTFRVEIIVRVGALSETREEIGFAHFIEHLMSFYPSKKWPNSIINQREINSRSLLINAWTEPNTVGYFMEGLEKYRDLMIHMIMENYTDPYLDKEVFEQERNAVIAELSNIINDNNYNIENMIEYVKHRDTNLGYSIEFERENVKNNATLDNIMTFRDKWYRPEYTSLILTSNLEKEDAEGLINGIEDIWFKIDNRKSKPKNYGKNLQDLNAFKSNFGYTKITYIPFPEQQEIIPLEQEQSKPLEQEQVIPLEQEQQVIPLEQRTTIRNLPTSGIFYTECSGDETLIEIHFPLDFTLFNDKIYTLDLVETILSQGLGSRLYYALRTNLGAVYNVSTDSYLDPINKKFSYFSICTQTHIDNIKNVLDYIFIEIEKMITFDDDYVTKQEWSQYLDKINIKEAINSCKNSSSKWLDYYKPYLLWGQEIKTLDETYKIQRNLKESQLKKFCKRLFDIKKIAIFYTAKEEVLNEYKLPHFNFDTY